MSDLLDELKRLHEPTAQGGSMPDCIWCRAIKEIGELRAEVRRRQEYDDQCDADYTITVVATAAKEQTDE